ncbi:MAG: hypothetical protein ACON4T_04710 [Synechococcus sp.]
MPVWNAAMEDDLVVVLKDWLKQQGRTQADLRRSLRASSTRMPALLEVLKQEHDRGGLPQLAARLCAIEAGWAQSAAVSESASNPATAHDAVDPFGQLDLLLQKIRDDSVS